ncbi:MAG TPA: hypothetical protein VF800_30695 [Telluria sp.]|jgi:hypothetical protein
MATQIPPTITPVPTPAIQRNDRTTFSNRVDAFVTWLIAAVTQFGAVATNVYNNAVDAATSATSALTNKGLSQQAADAAQSYRDQAKNSADAAAASATTIGTTAAFSDANPMVKNATVNTKQGRFKADLITAATIRDYQLPDKNGVMALTSDMGSALVGGPLVPTAAPYIDFLTLFASGGFDNYDIIINRVQPLLASTADTLCLRFVNAGTVDAGTLYASAAVGSGAGSLASSISGPLIRGQDVQTGNIEIQIRNANSATGSKTVLIRFIGNTLPSTSYQVLQHFGVYTAANAASGFRLFWAGGSNFAASGSVRVYGWKNA